MDTYFEGRLTLDAWFAKWIRLLTISCFIVFPLQMLVVLFRVTLTSVSKLFSKFASRSIINFINLNACFRPT